MALKSSLRLVVQRISEAVKRYASAQGWRKDDYALVGTFAEKSDRISLTLGTARQVDERQWYAGILQEIRKSFPEYPQITMHIGLVVRNVANLDEVYLDALVGEDEIDITEQLDRS